MCFSKKSVSADLGCAASGAVSACTPACGPEAGVVGVEEAEDAEEGKKEKLRAGVEAA
jgi:hypothetical protein